MMQDLQDNHIRATRRDTQHRDLGEGVRAAPGTRMDTSREMTGGLSMWRLLMCSSMMMIVVW
jgi:hypothetical protein